jgi:hypothetical protein
MDIDGLSVTALISVPLRIVVVVAVSSRPSRLSVIAG